MAGRFLIAAGRLAMNPFSRCASFWRALSIGRFAFFSCVAHDFHSSGFQRPFPIRRAKMWPLSICLAVGEYNAVLCANSFDNVRISNFILRVVGWIPCVCRNHPLSSACKLSLLVVPNGRRMLSALEKACLSRRLLKIHSTRSAAAAW